MFKVTSHDEPSIKEAYKQTLSSLLSMFETAISDWSLSDNTTESSSIFEKDLQRLLAQSVFALEMIRPAAYEMLLISRDYRTPETGFWRLAGECWKFLRRHHEGILQNEGLGQRRHLKPDAYLAPCALVSEYLTPESTVNSKEEGVAPPQSDITLTYVDDVIEGISDEANESVRRVSSESFPRCIVSADLVEASRCLAGLITLTESQSFESLLTSVCFKRNQSTKRDLGLVILESILATNGLQDADKTDFRNLSLAFGETPLVLAVRARDPDVVMTLVRHGADVNRGWMGLENALQVLLFSPNQIFLGQQDTAAIEKCLSYLLMVMTTIDYEALTNREKEGYYGLHPDWRGALRSAMIDSWGTDSIPVPSLQHLCRCSVRTSMNHLGCQILEGLHQLPLPVQLKQFIQLVE